MYLAVPRIDEKSENTPPLYELLFNTGTAISYSTR